MLLPGQTGTDWGGQVAGLGDLNGDGFSDVAVGARYHDLPESDEGLVAVYYGGHSSTGRTVLARQLRGGGVAVSVQPWGLSQDADDFQVRARATHPQGRGRVKLQVQACPAGVAFGHASCTAATSASWTDVTATSGGVTLTQTIAGLAEGTLYRWRARVLYAPLSVTQSGITAPPNPAHGPWRRLFGQALEGDVRILGDDDDDDDGLLDIHETDTGVYVSPTDTGTDPLDSDSDDDGLLDGAEVAFGTNPNDSDHDDDGLLDGADNCPFILNSDQANADTLPAGDLCQCGDVTNDGVVNASDHTGASEHVVGRTLGGTFVVQRCNVIGPNGGGAGDCEVRDLYVLERFAAGQPVTVPNACAAYGAP